MLTRSQPRRAASSVATAVVAAALGGHTAYWYLPRERSALVDADSAAGRLLSSDHSYRFWIAYPHQYLASREGHCE